jgi:hypothetical protein
MVLDGAANRVISPREGEGAGVNPGRDIIRREGMKAGTDEGLPAHEEDGDKKKNDEGPAKMPALGTDPEPVPKRHEGLSSKKKVQGVSSVTRLYVSRSWIVSKGLGVASKRAMAALTNELAAFTNALGSYQCCHVTIR